MWLRLILCSLCLVVAVLYFDRKHPSVDESRVITKLETEISRSQVLPETSAQASVVVNRVNQTRVKGDQASPDRSAIQLSAENLAELERCGLSSGAGPSTLDEVIQSLAQEAGKAEKRTLLWRNVHFRAQDGEERRLRVWRDFSRGVRGKLKAQLFTLDEEGLPVPVSDLGEELSDLTPSKVEQYLSGKKVEEMQEKLNLSFGEPRHLEISVETKNGRVRSVDAKDDRIAFQCFTAPEAQSTDCKCLSNRSSR